MDVNESFTIDERDEFGKIADHLASFVANFYDKDPSQISEEELGYLTVARAYLKLYMKLFGTG